jgi:uncharacterized glyoxalase superfamily protein PhnB
MEPGAEMSERNEIPQIIPYLYYEDASAAIDFMQAAFGFEVVEAFRHPESGAVLHASVSTGRGTIFVGAGMESFGTRGTLDADLVSSMTYVFVKDVQSHFARSVAAGAIVRSELHDHFGGNRQYTVSDPGGQRWTFAQPMQPA